MGTSIPGPVLARLVAAVVLVTLPAGCMLPWAIDRRMNRVVAEGDRPPSERAVALTRSLRIADLHADALLWGRNLLDRHDRGHVDVPRLREGHVAVQGFGVVTRAPLVLNIEHNDDDATDAITLMAIAQGWPLSTWGNLTKRALLQARQLHRVAERSRGAFTLLRSSTDLDTFLATRATDPSRTAGFLAIEGAQVLEHDLANVDVLFDAGFRMMAPTHYFDTEVGGSAHGERKGGLTELGRGMVRRMEALRMIVDLAHASPRTFADVLAMATRPVVVSHTGVRATCDNGRNLSDDQVRAVAANGGLIGIGYWDTAICGRNAAAVARAIRHVVDVAGIAHVALGSDFDGSVATPFDTTGLASVVDALLEQGFDEHQIALIMGETLIAFLRVNLPPG